MEIDGLALPELLVAMIDSGRWPKESNSINQQNLQSWIPPNRPRKLQRLCLYPPPFRTLRNAADDSFYRENGLLLQLNAELAITIADFGIGSDSPIVLYYGPDRSRPSVLFWEWQKDGKPNSWSVLADTFEAFVELLGI